MDHRVDMPAEAPVDTVTYHQGWDGFPELSDREKVALYAVADICRQTLGMPCESQGTMGLTHGVSGDALCELLLFQGDYTELQRHLHTGTRQLTDRERAFGSLTSDVLHGVLNDTFAAHVSKALAIGATPADVRAVIRFSAQFGTTAAWHGLRAADRLLDGPAGLADPFVA
ncbi:carboxymuconolactone decarboxylase family protein [Streptomyces sp. NBC_01477]|uniref:carboxymuconolactone decarboxylase family protein n=1 Tax=Streptomyces sp. NBC_01477 TaxID=2976015 RepID=UPI002E37B111|nr:carboxymuconolactone decarboxylase family protein [Streptomyces sp. NBC_01477]